MSGTALIWAANVKGLAPATKIVLIQLAERHNKDTGRCDPSLSLLADDCEMSRASVLRHLRVLEDEGIVSRVSRGRENGGRSSSQYDLNMGQRSQIETGGKGLKMSGQRSQNERAKVSTVRPPIEEPVLNLEEPVSDTNVSSSESDATSKAVSFFNETAQRVGWSAVQKITEPRKRAVRSRLKDVGGYEGWVYAVERAASSPFLTGNNDRGWRADFDWICKPSNFVKIMEGKYDRRDRPCANRPDAALENIARLAGLGEASGDGGF